ncbi:MAG: hypothetical protein A2W19_06445 [Spirochaetes bacterium RBG_16_49_21]|nr:MAG: hypothetical protein A2W19_06445 [Spirochaetes bacterium RBG_16_49_21]
MKRIFSKTIKFSRFTVSLFTNEIMLVFIGDKKIYIKNIRLRLPSVDISSLRRPRIKTGRRPAYRPYSSRRNNLPARTKKHAFALAAAILAISYVFSVSPSKQKNSIAPDDETIKKNLLLSKNTDYSSPEKGLKLIINEHTIARGDFLQKIAKKYGVSVETICGTNKITTDGILTVGAVLKIPNKDGILYTMQKGSDLVSIAKKYKVSLKKIIEENDLKNPDFVAANTVLFIPDAKPLNLFSGFIWPSLLRAVTCGYGWRRNPFEPSQTEFHTGLDIRSNFQWIKASKYGKVAYTGWLGGYGKTVVIAHPGGWKTLYAHLSRIIVKTGQHVKQGQLIAMSGNTGRSTGAHLHFEILRGDKNINPYIYFRKKRE